ncbi:MAG: hypothetical protein ACXAC7_02330 [Candidatus Hodarchaeales archaeon]|jgi:hypothetical protein
MVLNKQFAWETSSWQEILKKLNTAANKSLKSIEKINNPILDPTLLETTRDFLSNIFPSFLKDNGKDLYNLLEGLARKVVPLAESHVEASQIIINDFFSSSDSKSSESFLANNIEFLRKIVFCLEEPRNTDTSLSDDEFRMLERLVNAFSDRLKFNPTKNDMSVREDLIIVAFRKQGIVSGSIPRILQKISKFGGLISHKDEFYDINIGRKRTTRYYKFDKVFESLLNDFNLIEVGFNENNQKVYYLSNELPVQFLYAFIQGWRAVNFEPDVLGEYIINGLCNVLAYTVLMGLPEGKITPEEQIQQSSALLADEVCHPIIIALSQAIAYVIAGDLWLNVIWDSPKKSKYHRSARYVIVGNIIRIQQGAILLNNNVMTNYVRNYIIRIGGNV